MIEVRTHNLDLSEPAATVEIDVAAPAACAITDFQIGFETVTVALDVVGSYTSTGFDLIPDKNPTDQVALVSPKELKVPTTSLKFYEEMPRPKTYEMKCEPPPVPNVNALKMYGEPVVTFQSRYLDNYPQTREMLDLTRLGFPRISEFITKIAEQNHLHYSDIHLVGIFDPVPMHLATAMTLDTVTGKLRFHVRTDPKAKPKFARVAYARVRMTGEIVQALFPVT